MKSKIIFLALFSILLLPGCRDQFLDVENKNELDLGSFFKTKTDVELAVNTAYTPQGHGGLHGQAWQMKFGTLDDRIWHENPDALDRLVIVSDEFKGAYEDCYRGVFRCSDIIRNMKGLGEGVLTNDEYKLFEAQLRALRAYYYFNMVILWRSPFFYNEFNVPTNALANYGNCDPQLFWDQIDIDLKFATDPANGLKNNPWEWGADERGRVTRGGALALWGKVSLWKHYYYYLENGTDKYEYFLDDDGKSFDIEGGYNPVRRTSGGVSSVSISRDQNLANAQKYFKEVMSMGFTLQGGPVSAQGTEPAVTKQDFINALLSNSTFVLELTGFDGKTYRGENNNESLWEVQYNGDNRNAGGWLPAWQWGGAQNFQYTGIHASSYLNHEMDPDAFYLYEATTAGTRARAAGFDIDPRAYATFYLDDTPLNPGGTWLDWRPESGIYNRRFTSATDSKRKVSDPTKRLYQGDMPKGTGAVMKRKYSYPIYTTADGGSMPPNCDPFNVRVIRYADALLMYAEACLLSGQNTAEGLAALNEVRDRAGMPPRGDLSITNIILERDMELMAEGHRFLDIVRWSRDQQWFDAINFSTKSLSGYGFKENWLKYPVSDQNYPNIRYRTMYMPIPLSEINKNEGYLKQNPGY